MEIFLIIFQFAILFLSIMIHEISHGSMALALGDSTAKDMGRLTFNPLKHLDPVGSIIVPGILILLNTISGGRGFIFGWAKPVPFNPYNLKNPKRDAGLIGLAGPASNLVLACFFGGLIRLLPHLGINYSSTIIPIFDSIMYVNLMLMVFNLIPIPPLDGSRILYAILPRSAEKFIFSIERYGIFFLMIIILFGAPYLGLVINFLAKIISGQ